ncbi:metal ABC transporter solute-binding protein, Zn/Mn family [Croceimicrobium hydrocarbonivorans]|uniref:Zinc ABC transporter substrate-binding protein n=1 Tax=Croceimicrobium hydrocarbonivorans TaxID=2761580 RepID=A0A7H0VJK1_9FLAO|nr:zinc ABC transporter substrate-binding protein [Croceimicrobium hydrocarbonivorans]QNR25899.1 zinc ABC transporter substrate-binding protein [Croceimicrobium hydrocarbonivorans]
MRIWWSLLLVAFLISCEEAPNSDKYQIVCTTGMLADMTSALCQGIDSLEIQSLMGPGTDPHLYKASQADVFALSRADLIVFNGLHLEGKMAKLFHKLPEGRVYPAAEVLSGNDLINASAYQQAYDPHVWFDLTLWSKICLGLELKLQEKLLDHKDLIANNAERYRKRLANLHNWALKELSQIPEKQRVLVTAHDAFKYFGRAYQVEVKGLQGISTTAEFGLRDISDLAEFISSRKVKAVFVESSVSPRAIEAVREAVKRRGWDLQIGGELYSDAMGPPQSGADHFYGMFRSNVETILSALK